MPNTSGVSVAKIIELMDLKKGLELAMRDGTVGI